MHVARTVAVVTGTRADYGLLQPVMRAIEDYPQLRLQVLACGAHLLSPAMTIEEVRLDFEIHATIALQEPGQVGRIADALALGRGISGFACHFAKHAPDVVLVLGDRIEAFAAAAAASVGGIRVAHLHGGDRAEGIADESMRHAITKLAHIHFPATATSAQRLAAMGEDPLRIHMVGSPAIDGLSDVPALPDDRFEELGIPEIVVALHPTNQGDEVEDRRAARLLQIAQKCGRVLALHPNHDAGRTGILNAIERAGTKAVPHLARPEFVGLLRRAKVLIGNSSAGLIEASAIPIRAINIGTRQAGRETPANVITIENWDYQTIEDVLRTALDAPALLATDVKHPYGSGSAGPQVAAILASFDPAAHALVKRNTY